MKDRPKAIVLAVFVVLACLICHTDEYLPEIATVQHANEGFGCLFQTIDDVLAIANAALGDPCGHLAQKLLIMLSGEVVSISMIFLSASLLSEFASDPIKTELP